MNQNCFSRKAFYYETDGMRIVHHSNYIRWLEEARVWWLSQIGYSYERMEYEGVMIPVLDVSCKYRYPVRFDDEFAVYMMIEQFTGVRFRVKYKLYNVTAGKLSAEAESSHCFVSPEMTPLRTKHSHPEIYKLFKDAEGRKDWYIDE